jgi:protein tyrosine phosphatase (PTP) superfamily phosphohydrolase (DUF442 family)
MATNVSDIVDKRAISGGSLLLPLPKSSHRYTEWRAMTKMPRATRLAFRVVLLGIAVGIGLGLWVLALRISGNIHTVEEGALYRSGQLSASRLTNTIKTFGIKSVINLRLPDPKRAWYRDERAVSDAMSVQHFDFTLSVRREPDDADITRLVQLMRDAPKPILVHCDAGADRSGLASALYKLVIAERPVQEASGQLSLWYGHFPWLLSRSASMDRAFARYSIRAQTQH